MRSVSFLNRLIVKIVFSAYVMDTDDDSEEKEREEQLEGDCEVIGQTPGITKTHQF